MIALLAQVSTGFLFLSCWRDLFCSWSVLNGVFFSSCILFALFVAKGGEKGAHLSGGGGGMYGDRRDERERGICVTFFLWVNNSMLSP